MRTADASAWSIMAASNQEVIDLSDDQGDNNNNDGDDEGLHSGRAEQDEGEDALPAEDQELFNRMNIKYSFMATKFVLKDIVPKEGSKDFVLKFQCQICPTKTIYKAESTSLSNLRTHIKRCHSSHLAEYEKLWLAYKKQDDGPSSKKPRMQPKMNEFFKPSGSSPEWTPIISQGQIDRAVVNFVIDCNAPYRYTEKDSFKALVLLGESDPDIK